MAVYTPLDEDALVAWLARHDVGTLVEWHGIAAGIENSNFFVTTRDGPREQRFVLTVFERLRMDELAFYLSLMEHLARHGTPCPAPMPDRDGGLCSTLAGKPAALVTRLDGRSVLAPTPRHCAALGTMLARMHRAGGRFAMHQPNPRGIDWWIDAARRVRDFLDADQASLLDDEIATQAACWRDATRALPRGAVHADLFRDNVLFVDDEGSQPELRGVIDFYFAGDDAWLFDVAVCINDWCIDLDSGALDHPRRDAFVEAYESERPLMAAERDALPLALRAAALRFWLSRLDDLHRPRPAELLTPHDPRHFQRILRRRREDAAPRTLRPDRRSEA